MGQARQPTAVFWTSAKFDERMVMQNQCRKQVPTLPVGHQGRYMRLAVSVDLACTKA